MEIGWISCYRCAESRLQLNRIPKGADTVELWIVTNKPWKQGSTDAKNTVTLDAWIHKANKLNDAYIVPTFRTSKS